MFLLTLYGALCSPLSVRYDAIEMNAVIIIVNKTPECNIFDTV